MTNEAYEAIQAECRQRRAMELRIDAKVRENAKVKRGTDTRDIQASVSATGIHISNIITVQTCVECGHLANVALSCSQWACGRCTRVQATEYQPNDFESLVRLVCPVGGQPDEVGVTLGGVGFWIDADGPWQGQLSFSHPVSQWDLPALKRDLTARLTGVANG